ncbi:MAG: glycosyltransferase [Nitrosomonadales bacterium]|nr:glycosyltransferase [Nitrosomonadales bacterium]
MQKTKKRILLVVANYPQISETYIKNEIDTLWDSYNIEILALTPGNHPYRTRRPHLVLTDDNRYEVTRYLRSFAPDVIHGHYYTMVERVHQISQVLNAPYTIRNHSFDVTGTPPDRMRNITSLVNQDACLGVLTYPYTCSMLEQYGVQHHKIVSCYPVLHYKRFHDTRPNGKEIMNLGAAIPKKNMEDYLRLSTLVPERAFNLYAMGYDTSSLVAANKRCGGRVNFIPPVEPEDMPAEYKRHEWLVYTASRQHNTVGWPMAVAEAQAAGVGVCVQNIRPDIRRLVGDAGFVFDTPAEAAGIIRQPFPDDLRHKGFDLAKRCDIADHIRLLTGLWENRA